MTNYFKDSYNDLNDLKADYKVLAKKHHPDIGGDLETMKAINNEYERLLKDYNNGFHSTDEKEIYRHGQEMAAAENLIRIIGALIKYHGVTVELCGSWVWVSGATKEIKETLKENGFRWASAKKMWYWRPDDYKAGKHKTWDMNEIRMKHGSQLIKGIRTDNQITS